MPSQPNLSSAMIALALLACGKSSTETSEQRPAAPTPSAASGSAPAGSGSAAAEPAEAAAVVGPTKSASGTLEVSGALTGTFEWKKKDQLAPITCIWDPDKEIGTFRIDVSDGAGHLLTLGIDIPPTDVGPGRLDVSSKALAAPLKTYSGFKLKGDNADAFTVAFDSAEAVTDPDAQLKAKADKKKKTAGPPAGPQLTIKGQLDVTCPKKK